VFLESVNSTVLGMVKRNFRRLYEEDFLIIYKTYVRPHLEYCIQVWSPHLATDILCLEKIQCAATKIVPGLKKLAYGDRLKRLGLTTVETWRKRGDLMPSHIRAYVPKFVSIGLFCRPLAAKNSNFCRQHLVYRQLAAI